MDDGAPSLEVGFTIDTTDSFGNLTQLDALIDTATANAIAEFANVERASKNMLDLGGATASVTTFGAAATRELQSAAKAIAQTEKAGEAMVRQLDRQNTAFGKSREELRGMKAEAAALAAEQQGLSELADRIRTAEAALYAQEFAAARQARQEAEALAQDRTTAAEQAVAAAAREADAIRKAASAYQLFEAAARAGMQTLREQQTVEQAAAAASKASQAAAVASAAQLRAQLDPLWAAQKRYDDELVRYDDLLRRDLLSEAEHRQAVKLSATALADAKQALDGHSNSLGLNRMQFVIGASAAHRFVDSIMAGTSPMRAFMMQAGDVATVLQMDDGGVAGGLAKVRSLITPVTVGITALAATVAIGTAAWLDYSNATEKAQALSIGAGRVIGISAGDIEAQAKAAAGLATISVGAARDIITGYVEMGGIGKSVLGGLTALSVDFAAATGKDSKAAVEELGRAFQDPAKGADELTQRYGALSQAQVEHIKNLVEANDLYGAQRALLNGLEPAFDGAAEHANGLVKAWHWIATAAADAWNWMGAAIDRAAGGGPILQKIADLQKQRAQGPTLGQMLTTGTSAFNAGIDKQIADLQRQLQVVDNAAARSKAVPGMKLVDSIVGEDDVGNLRTRLNTVKGLLADNGKAAGLTAEQVGNARQAYEMLTHAVTTYLPEADKQVKLAQLDAQIATAKKAHDQGAVATLAAQRSQIENSGKLMTAAQAEAQATANGTRAKLEAVKAGDRHAETLVREAEAMNAQISNTYKLADAYGVSGAAALIAEARVKAESQAIKQRGDIEAAVVRQVALAVAQRVADGAKSTAAMNDQATIQEAVNASIVAGIEPAQRAAEIVRERMADLPLLAALQAANDTGNTDGAKRVDAALEAQRAARVRLTAAERDGARIVSMAQGNDQLAVLREELSLISATDAARVHALATLKATQEAEAQHRTGKDGVDYVEQQVALADGAEQLAAAQRDYNDALSFTADKWDLIARNVQNAGQGMADAFGGAGKAIGDLASTYASYQADRARLDQQHAADLKAAGTRQAAIDRANTKFALSSSTQQVGAYGDMAEAAKGFFSEKSKGYKAIQAAEQVFRAFEFAMSVRSMVQDAIETVSSVTNSGARAVAAGAEGVAHQSKLPFPYNLAAMAATAAALVAAGIAVIGGGGGGHVADPGNIGTGTVLGDTAAKSDSIKNALDALKEVDTVGNTFAREMAASLKSIDSQIGGVASLVVRAGNVDASAGITTGFNNSTGKTVGAVVGAVLGPLGSIVGGLIGSLFGTRTDIIGGGIYGAPQTVGSVVGGGFNGQTYSDLEKTHKFLGIVSGRSYETQYGGLDSSLNNQFTLILKQFDTAIAAAAGPLGVATDEVQSRLDSFVINIGKIDLQGLTGAEIQEKLNAVFGAAADDMANAAFPGIEKFQKVGEGAFETLVRVASTIEAVTNSLDLLGGAAVAMGVDAKLGLADQFDSVSDFTSAADAYFQGFYTKEEQAAAKTAEFGKVFDSLGLSMPTSLAAFRQLVDAQDLTTAAGQATYATLLKLAPAFSDLETALLGAKSAADILSEREDLQRQKLELEGNTAAIRALDLAKLDASNRALQEQIWAIQDAQAAATAAKELSDAWTSVGDSIMDEVKRIRGLTSTTSDGGFASLLGQFNAANAAARAGDMDAAKSLPGLSQSLLTAAAQVATSRQELARVQAQTAAALEATNAAVSLLGSTSTTSDAAVLSSAAAAQAPSSAAAANDDMASEIRALRDELAQLRADNNAGHAATAGNTGKIARKLDDVTADSGGNAISVANAA